jgi:GNAT superfamily N-acetyltransferase
VSARIEPITDLGEVREYIDRNWAAGHILARDLEMATFTYATPWVDRAVFPGGYSVIGARGDDGRLVGFIGSIAAPYPRRPSYWTALWHVLPEMKGTGTGDRLLQELEDIALAGEGWVGTFGAGRFALPVFLNRGYTVRGARRWLYDADVSGDASRRFTPNTGPWEAEAPETWFEYRFDRHPRFAYERHPDGVFRTEENAWGRVTHAVWLKEGSAELVRTIHERESAIASRDGRQYLFDAWAFDSPGPSWRLAPPDLPSVFHPPQSRGNITFAVGLPFLPGAVQKGDCDQDRPN